MATSTEQLSLLLVAMKIGVVTEPCLRHLYINYRSRIILSLLRKFILIKNLLCIFITTTVGVYTLPNEESSFVGTERNENYV